MNDFPTVCFCTKPKDKVAWLEKKRELIEKRWNQKNDGQALVKKIIRTCNLPFPKNVGTIYVTLEPISNGKGFLGNTDAFEKPNKITLFVKKRQHYRDIKSTLCHELVHSICWCNTMHDKRRTIPSYFADMFADELLTTLLEAQITKPKMARADYEWALDYARGIVSNNLKNLKRSKDYELFVDGIEFFLKDYKKQIKNGSNILLQREKLLTYIRSPNC